MTGGDIMRMNTVSIYLLFLCAIWGGRRYPFAMLAAAGVTLANGLMHTANTVVLGEYNPGLATSLLLFLPGATWVFYHAFRVLGISGWLVIGGVAYGLIGHVALLPLCVLWHTPLWLMGGFALIPLLANVLMSPGARPQPVPAA